MVFAAYLKNKKIYREKKCDVYTILSSFPQQIFLEKKRKKIKRDDFEILKLHEYKKITKLNYNVSQLKKMCKYYKLPVGGNKGQLTKRIYTILKLSFFSKKIQKLFRAHIVRKFFALSGPALYKRDLCVNKTDFLTLEDLETIPPNNFISFKDKDNFIYGFELDSIFNLIIKNKRNQKNFIIKNPYNRSALSTKNINLVNQKIRYAKLLKVYKSADNIKKKVDTLKLLKFKIVDIFHKIDMFGHTTNHLWFLSLSRYGLIKFIKELKDIWFHRLDLTNDMRRRIFPPTGNPFINLHQTYLVQKNRFYLQNVVINLIEQMITRGMSQDERSLGVFYILTALTLVSTPAATSMPWLFDSVNNAAPAPPPPPPPSGRV